MNKVPNIELTKLYYTIGEVAKIFNVNASLIRFWEKEFKLEVQKKNLKGNRLFSQKEIEKFNKIYTLVKLEGYTLEGAKKMLKSKNSSTSNIEMSSDNHSEIVIQKLEKIKAELLKLKRND